MWKIKKKNRIFFNIIIILCWMGIVFVFSNQSSNTSNNLSNSITAEIVDVVHKNDNLTSNEKEQLTKQYNVIIRKLAHFTIYLIGGIVIVSFISELTNKKWIKIIFTAVFGIMYASSDEIHQYFIPGRTMNIVDVVIDSMGIITGIIVFLTFAAIVEIIKDKEIID